VYLWQKILIFAETASDLNQWAPIFLFEQYHRPGHLTAPSNHQGPDAMTEATVRIFASVWDALEETPEDAANMRLRSELMTAVRDAIEAWQLTQAQAAKRLKITQPRLNDLMRGRIGKFSLDALIVLAERSGLPVRMEAAPARRPPPREGSSGDHNPMRIARRGCPTSPPGTRVHGQSPIVVNHPDLVPRHQRPCPEHDVDAGRYRALREARNNELQPFPPRERAWRSPRKAV
jgi:predicted XRE-type DNA-binding protein